LDCCRVIVQHFCINCGRAGLLNHSLADLLSRGLSIIKVGNMASPKKAIVIFSNATNLESGNGTKGSSEICSRVVPRDNDPPPNNEFSDSQYDSLCNLHSLCNLLMASSTLGYFVKREPPKLVIWN